jgi:DNA-binding NarL/FixJ family response regulator
MPIAVSIVEDDDRIRESLVEIFKGTGEFRLLHTYRSGEEAREKLLKEKPDVVLMDINLPGMSGINCVQKLKALDAGLHVVMLTVFEDTDKIFQALVAGACGYLVKRTPPEEILAAIKEVHRGGAPMSTQIARKVVQSFHKMGPSSKETENLTDREMQILDGLAKGYLCKEIADQLGISLETVRTHMKKIYEKLHVRSRTQAVLKYLGK